jgi:hypothetical protein
MPVSDRANAPDPAFPKEAILEPNPKKTKCLASHPPNPFRTLQPSPKPQPVGQAILPAAGFQPASAHAQKPRRSTAPPSIIWNKIARCFLTAASADPYARDSSRVS